MPSINAVIAAGRDVQTCRRLIAELSQVALDVLDSVPLLSRGRSPEVLLALLTRFTGVTQDVLGVERRHVHVVLRELPREHIGEMGVPMAAPGDPRWFTGGLSVPPRTSLLDTGAPHSDASPIPGLA
ncbi:MULTISPECIES: tautomerase family protein [Streptomyces]|uniref:4-oxalocrotonate tautomerase family protein n=2 Tax=Streptomyces TaxID=1883 RepID=A0ABV9J4W7_9ACTN